MKITQHLLQECEIKKDAREFTTLEELMKIKFVNAFTKLDDFHQFSICRLSETKSLLMSEHAKGTIWWVVGDISTQAADNLNIPEWHINNKTKFGI